MLRQEDPHSSTDTQSAAQARVTPEELAHAIAALESRKLDEARKLDGTLSIGEAVTELGLDATPEEVLAEVRAQRDAQSAPPSAQNKSADPPKTAPPQATPPAQAADTVPPLPQTVADALRQAALAAAPGLKDAAHAASPALKKGLDAVTAHVKETNQRRHGRRKAPWAVFGVFFAIVGITQGGLLSGHHGSHNIGIHIADQTHSALLSTVTDGQQVSATQAAVVNIAHGANPATVTVQEGGSLDNGWKLIRHDGHWYVRGYVLDGANLTAGPVKVYNDDNAGILDGRRQEDVTLRLDNSQITGTNSSDDWSEIDMSKIQPDIYTNEDW